MLDPLNWTDDLDKNDSKNWNNQNLEPEKKPNIWDTNNGFFNDDKKNENQAIEGKSEEIITVLSEPKNENQAEQSKNTNIETDKKDDNLSDFEKLLNSKDEEKVWNTILNININSIEDLIKILNEKSYEYLTMEWNDDGTATISFKNWDLEKEKIFIKYPIYSRILLKIKSSTKLEIDQTDKSQEWKWEMLIDWKNYNLISKTTPSNLWEKVFFSAIISDTIWENNTKKKMSIWKMLWFLWITALLAVILWWAFVIFILLNAWTDVNNVKFFLSLWIKLSEINSFVLNIVTIVFSLVVFIETIITIIYFFKFFLTKKEEKRKRVVSSIIWITFTLLIFITLTIWMFIYKKIIDLPNWEALSNWIVIMYDNDKLIKFNDRESALISDTKKVIWPVSIKYDLTYLAQREEKWWFKIKKYTWDFWWNNTIDTQEPIAIHKFDKSWTFKIWLEVEWYDSIKWEESTKKIEEIPSITIVTIDLNERVLNSWWKVVDFNATNIKDLWNIEWFSGDDLTKPIISWPKFNLTKPIFKDTFYVMRITNEWDWSVYEKVFIISWEEKSDIDWEIVYEQNPDEDLNTTLKVKNIKNSEWNWYINNFKWYIWNEIIEKTSQIDNQEKSSELNYIFRWYWDKEIKVILTSSNGKTKELTKIITIKKSLLLKDQLKFYNDNQEIDVKYKNKTHEYFIDTLWVPTTLKIDSSEVTSEDIIYNLSDVSWDTDWDWKIDKVWKTIDFEINTEWNKNVVAYYTFEHRRIKWKKLNMQENIYITWVKKESQLDLQIYQPSSYAPVSIKFDASKSEVKNENIVKFIYNYWDWTPDDERDAINPWHKYIKNGEYTVSLTVITESWKKYSIKKQIVLKPEQEIAKISSSLRKATTDQWIDFSSDESKWQIVWYFWDFWDGENSTEANPTHSYKSPWIYKVELRLDFVNNNSATDGMSIEIQ
jgi:PKD repeat protein